MSACSGDGKPNTRRKRRMIPIDDRFVEACQMLDYTEYLADFLCAADLEEQIRAVDELMGDGLIRKLHQRLEEVNNDGRAA